MLFFNKKKKPEPPKEKKEEFVDPWIYPSDRYNKRKNELKSTKYEKRYKLK